MEPTPRTTVHRLPKRAVYDRARIDAILDAGMICHIGFVDNGSPCVLPTGYVRVGDWLYVHGSAASHMLRALVAGAEACVTVTHLDGLVLARSAFHHSVNYRSVVVFGKARLVAEPREKWDALRAFTNHVVEGRWEEVRQPNEQELKGTTVVAIPIDEASAKVRLGPPIDDEEDFAAAVWAGYVPVSLSSGDPIPDARLAPGAQPPAPERLVLNRAHALPK